VLYARDARARDSLETSNDYRRYKNVGELSLVPNRGASDTVSHFTNVILWWGREKERTKENKLPGSQKCMF